MSGEGAGSDRADPLAPFRGPAYKRLFENAHKVLAGNGGNLAAKVSIAGPSIAERDALDALTGVYRKPETARIAVRLADVDTALRTATGIGLLAVLTDLIGDPMKRAAEKSRVARARSKVLAEAGSSALHPRHQWYRDWLDWVDRNKLTQLVNKGDEHLVGRAVSVFAALDEREARGVRRPLPLPVLAVRTLGDTKALDARRQSTLNTLILRGLTLWRALTWPGSMSAEVRREIWDAFDIVVDEFASRVLVLNLRASGACLGEWLNGAAEVATPFQITLHQILRHPITVSAGLVHVCENPAVLRRAADELGVSAPPLLCTEGRPSTAFHRLAAVLTEAGCELRYHGDFDWPGIDMTANVLNRHHASPWRMGAADYLAGLRSDDLGILLGEKSRATPWEPALSEAMRREGRAVYEEAVEEPLLADLRALV